MRIAGVLVAAALMAFTSASPAPADPPQFDGGAVPTVGDFNPVTLNGTDQLTSATITPFVVKDDSGALAGWNVTLLVPDFRNGTGADCATDATASIAGANVSMNAPVVTAADISTSMTGITASGFTDFTTPRKIIVADAGDGAGTYDVAPGILNLIVPATSLVGAYCSEATIAITTGP
jgi:hypothetical protein